MTALLVHLALAALQLTPLPQKATVNEGRTFRVHPGTPLVVADDASAGELANFDALFQVLGFHLPIQRASEHKGAKDCILVGEPPRHAAFQERKFRRPIGDGLPKQPQGYFLSITRDNVILAGVDPAGTFYALQSLLSIARAYPEGWPETKMSDWPDTAQRGAIVNGPLTTDQIAAFAALKCNRLFFRSNDFYALEGARAEVWARVFAEARRMYIEPVPALGFLDNATPLLYESPRAVEGRTATEQVILRGDDWAALQKRNIIHTEDCPVLVSVSGIACVYGKDYLLEPGPTHAPFPSINAPWLIRRVPGGIIPSGASVQATYSHAPPNSSALCPHAPETAAMFRAVLEALDTTLTPDSILVDLAPPDRIRQDIRCVQHTESEAQALGDGIAMIEQLAAALKAAPKLVLWESLRQSLPASQEMAGRRAPLLLSRVGAPGLHDAPLDLANRVWVVAYGDELQAYALAERMTPIEGILVEGGNPESVTFRRTMDKAWSAAHPRLSWPQGLNDLFGAQLWEPGFDEQVEAIARYFNRRTLRGESPWADQNTVRDRISELKKLLPGQEIEVSTVEALYRVFSEYLELEATFTLEQNTAKLRPLPGLVDRYADLDPAFDQDRRVFIQDTIRNQGLFPPPSILFGRELYYYRPAPPAWEGTPLRIPIAPEYDDDEGVAAALLDTTLPVGPVCRVDFETLGANGAEVFLGPTPPALVSMGKSLPQPGIGLRGPFLIDVPRATRLTRISVESFGPTTILRDVHVFALKASPHIFVPYTRTQPTPEEFAQWPDRASAMGFVRSDLAEFAEAPTLVRLGRDRTRLFIAASAAEPRMHAMSTLAGDRDAPLWEQESVGVILDTGSGKPYRFIANPEGVQYDSLGGDAGWDGMWDLECAKGEAGWTALFILPFKTLGAAPQTGTQWKANFTRYRRNAIREESSWARVADRSSRELGTLVFDPSS